MPPSSVDAKTAFQSSPDVSVNTVTNAEAKSSKWVRGGGEPIAPPKSSIPSSAKTHMISTRIAVRLRTRDETAASVPSKRFICGLSRSRRSTRATRKARRKSVSCP